MPIAGLRQVTALRRGAEQPFAAICVGRSGRLRHRAWEGQGSAGRHERAALLRGKRAGCGNPIFYAKKPPAWMQRGKVLCLFKIAIWRVICLLECTSTTSRKAWVCQSDRDASDLRGRRACAAACMPKGFYKNGGQEFWHEQAALHSQAAQCLRYAVKLGCGVSGNSLAG